MPELPEVETMRRGILPVVGATIAAVECPQGRCKPIRIEPAASRMRARLVGQRIVAVERAGKRVVLCLASGEVLVFEPRMTGLVLLSDPPNREHLRFRLILRGRGRRSVWYWDRRGLGTVELMSRADLERVILHGKLGPDALAISREEFQHRLSSSRRPIKVVLLDQKRVAGIGNLYASEILHVAQIHPAISAAKLRPAEWERIYEAMVLVLQEAIHYEGSTLSDGTYRNVLNRPGGYQNHHRVYDREGLECPGCRRQKIARIVQAQRATFFCGHCQRATGRKTSSPAR